MRREKDEMKKSEENPLNQKNPRHHASRNLWPPIFAGILTVYTAFTLLDAFVIPGDVVSMEELARSGDAVESGLPDEESEPVVTATSYTSDGISITITTLERYDTQVYAADVILSDASYLKTGLAGGTFGRNISDTTSEIAEENDAILAINGDYYGFRKRGYVMRNGYLYRDTAQNGSGQEDLVIYEDGSLEIITEAETDASELAEAGAVQIFSFGPGLIEDGEIAVDESSEVEQAMRSNPRTAIGEIEPLHYVFVVSDGRTKESAGLTLLELAEVMQELGCETAYNLDGGGSSTMWFMGEIVNHPTNGHRSGERSVSDIVYISES
ncbi:MAG: phosphodiester glycosidase family protein [Clostridiales bacterium]|nr:phosphodiester glycosidase family protein [Clostridiales bacterium]